MEHITAYLSHIVKTARYDSLYSNALYGIASSVILAIGGFLFWFVGARFYLPKEIGLATAIVAAMTLIIHVSNLGLDAALVRFLPKSDKKQQLVSGSFLTVGAASFLVASAYLLFLPMLSPYLTFLRDSIPVVLLTLFLLIWVTLSFTIESVFLAYKSVQFTLLKNSLASVCKILLLFVFIPFGAYGVFLAWSVGIAIALGIGFVFLSKKLSIRFDTKGSFKPVRAMATFSSVNYVIGFLGLLPTFLIPIFITNLLSPEDAAYYYIPMMIAGLLYFIPFSITQSLFAEGSHSEDALVTHTKKALKLTILVLSPAIIITYLFGNYLLLFFGSTYATEGFGLLRILALSGIFVAGNYVFLTLCNIKRKLKTLVVVNIIGASTITVLSVFLLSLYSLEGIGYAWMIGQIMMNVLYTAALLPIFFPSMKARIT